MQRGRDKEVKLIRQANRAAAVGRLMLGEFESWYDFLEADIVDLNNLPRKNLKGAVNDIKQRLKAELKKFTDKNFENITTNQLSELYEEIKTHRGFELPLKEFENKYSEIKKPVLKGCPSHLTISISLWGLKLKFPEDELSKDIIEGLKIANEAQKKLDQYSLSRHNELKADKAEIGNQIKIKNFGSRSVLLACFNLIESYLNGLAWDYLENNSNLDLSNRKLKLLQDQTQVSIRDKILKYPLIITDQDQWTEQPREIDEFIDIIKPFRDSLVHPSPFTAPERFGGYDKLRTFYRIDIDTANICSKLMVEIIEKIHDMINSEHIEMPRWLSDLKESMELFNSKDGLDENKDQVK